MSKKLIFVCSPYSGDVEKNTVLAREYCRYVLDQGHIPFAPHLLYPQFMSEETERKLAMENGKCMLSLCDEIWDFGARVTNGMVEELEYAHYLGIPVHHVELS